MSSSLVHVNPSSEEPPFAITQAQAILRQMVLDSVPSIHSERNYAKALDDLFAFSASRPLPRSLLMEYRTTIDHLSPSTINVRLSAIRKLVGEARRNGMIGLEEAANLSDVPNASGSGERRQELGSLNILFSSGREVGHHRSPRQGRPYPYGRSPDLGEAGN
jgi:hypothetical protein